jgi:hypothetical protein
MRFSEGLFAAQSAATLLCSLATGNKFRQRETTSISHASPLDRWSVVWAEGIHVGALTVVRCPFARDYQSVGPPRRATRHAKRVTHNVDPPKSATNQELLFDDPDFDLRVDIRMQADLDPVDSEGANRLMQLDLALLDREPLGIELVGDVRSGN